MTVRTALFLALLTALFLARPSFGETAAPQGLTIHFFYGQGCPHCKKAEIFLRECEQRYGNLQIHSHEVYFDPENMDLLKDVAERLGVEPVAVPFLVVGQVWIVGFDETFTPPMIRMEIEKCLVEQCPDFVAGEGKGAREAPHPGVAGGASGEESPGQGAGSSPVEGPLPGRHGAQEAVNRTIPIPLLGEINASGFSLPLLTVVMGFLDGFNPCAMWALVFLIGLLLGMRDRTRMWLLGATFIAASAFVYFLFMAAWLNLILFFGLVFWVRVAIGLIALAGGAYSLRDALVNTEISCKMTGEERRRQFRTRLGSVIGQHRLLWSMAGIAVLAFMVNLVEIVCSAGFPAIYTQVLSLNALPAWQYYAYILLYILFFMLDDMVVFVAAMLTLEIAGATTTYVRYARLLGGVLMLVIGALLIFRPQWLMFG
jgi:glutaredoxin